ncbi:hypothetical protein ABMA27_010889 [Loxostege sticticalis]|uniref:Uncharacterized protein n=1 Tax=Loxostege sticticalis TaxID=481309 RepID=A0ABR3H2K9_LOXSC
MISKTIFIVAVVIKATTSQRLPYYPQAYPEPLIDRYASPSTQLAPIPTTISTAESDALCKNLATAIQNVIFDRFSQNCLRTPVFGQIAPPLIQDIKNSLCQCPLCSTVNVTPNGYSKSYISPNAVSNIIKSSVPNTISNTYPRVNPNVSVNRRYTDLLAVLGGFGCDCGCRGPVVV